MVFGKQDLQYGIN